jgi:hypothetical protein
MNHSIKLFDENLINSINFIHEVKVYNEIQNEKKILIFDLRKREDFDRNHLDLSVNIPFDEFDYSFFENIDENKISELTEDKEIKSNVLKYKRFYIVLVISQNKICRRKIISLEDKDDEEHEMIKKGLIFYKAFLKNRVREIGLYNHGFKKIINNYPFIVQSIKEPPIARYLLSLTLSNIAGFPSEIIDRRLYVGDQLHVYTM